MNYNPTGQKERRFVGGVPANTVDMVTSGSIGNRAISYFRFALFRMLQLGLFFLFPAPRTINAQEVETGASGSGKPEQSLARFQMLSLRAVKQYGG